MALSTAELAHLIRKQHMGSIGDPTALTATLNAGTITREDSERHVPGDVIKAVEDDVLYKRFADSFEAAAASDSLVKDILEQYRSQGLRFNDPKVQAAIDDFAANSTLPLTIADAAKIKAIGVKTLSPYQDAGGDGTVTEAEVTTAIGIAQLREKCDAAFMDIVTQIDAGTLANWSAVQAHFASIP